jgi:hypothetical protein
VNQIMQKVVMLVSMAAASWSLVPGDVTEVTDEIAASWLENGIAKLYVQEDVKTIEFTHDEPQAVEELTENNQEPLEQEAPEERAEPVADLKSLGGGWYELPNSERVRGKEEATEALKNLNV